MIPRSWFAAAVMVGLCFYVAYLCRYRPHDDYLRRFREHEGDDCHV